MFVDVLLIFYVLFMQFVYAVLKTTCSFIKLHVVLSKRHVVFKTACKLQINYIKTAHKLYIVFEVLFAQFPYECSGM